MARPHIEGVDVVSASTEHTGDACKHAELVLDEDGDGVTSHGLAFGRSAKVGATV